MYNYKRILSIHYCVFVWVTPFSAHCISDHRISNQKVRTVMVRVRVRVRSAVVRNTMDRKVVNRLCVLVWV